MRLSVLKISVFPSLRTVMILNLVTPFAQRHAGRLWAPVAVRRHSEFNGRALLEFRVGQSELGDVEEDISAPRAPDKAETAVTQIRLDDSFFSHRKTSFEPLEKTLASVLAPPWAQAPQ